MVTFQAEFFPRDPEVIEGGQFAGAENKILVIFLHGSEDESRPDAFVSRYTTPPVILGIAGANVLGKEVFVLAIDDSDIQEAVVYDSSGRDMSREPKFVKRFWRLGSAIKAMVERGFLPSHIFVSGHSAGGWIGLLAIAKFPDNFAGAIAFAPAFAGKPDRGKQWSEFRNNMINDLTGSVSLHGLVFAFEGDEYEPADEIEAIFSKIPNVQFIRMNLGKSPLLPLSQPLFHCGAYHDRFANRASPTIIDFIKSRLIPNQ